MPKDLGQQSLLTYYYPQHQGAHCRIQGTIFCQESEEHYATPRTLNLSRLGMVNIQRSDSRECLITD